MKEDGSRSRRRHFLHMLTWHCCTARNLHVRGTHRSRPTRLKANPKSSHRPPPPPPPAPAPPPSPLCLSTVACFSVVWYIPTRQEMGPLDFTDYLLPLVTVDHCLRLIDVIQHCNFSILRHHNGFNWAAVCIVSHNETLLHEMESNKHDAYGFICCCEMPTIAWTFQLVVLKC